jgi:predicted ATPase
VRRAVTDREGGLVLVEGDAGIGKTTVVTALARQLGGAVPVCWARCWSEGGTPPYWPWVQLLDVHLASLEVAQRRAAVADAGAALAALGVGDGVTTRPGQPVSGEWRAAARFELFRAIVGVLARASGVAPALYMLDGLHCADVGSTLLLAQVARRCRVGCWPWS